MPIGLVPSESRGAASSRARAEGTRGSDTRGGVVSKALMVKAVRDLAAHLRVKGARISGRSRRTTGIGNGGADYAERKRVGARHCVSQ